MTAATAAPALASVPVAPPVEPIHVLMGRVLADLPAIGKDGYNDQQKFAFRGIDQVLDALNPILSKHGVFYLPEVIERVPALRTAKSGGVVYEVNLHVRYRFYGPAGDYLEASGWGEGTDSGDKATNKAMTNAMKYVLFQVFAISTAEAAAMDADHVTPEETVQPVVDPLRVDVKQWADDAPDSVRAEWSSWWEEKGYRWSALSDENRDAIRLWWQGDGTGSPTHDESDPERAF